MKKLLFLFCLVICSISISQAQFSLGMSGGINYNQINSDQTDSQVNYYFGFRPTFVVSSKINFGIGIQYSTKGYEIANEPDIPFSVATRLSYADILPQLEYRPIKMLGIMAGMNLGYPFSSQTKIDNAEWSERFKVGDSLERLDVGILLGARLYVKQFYLTMHYNHGLKDDNFIQFTDANGEPLVQTKKFRTVQIGLGYLVDL